MSNRKPKKKKSKILNLKILIEEKEITKEESEIGQLNLNEVLTSFSKRIASNQKEMFDRDFLGKVKVDTSISNKNLSEISLYNASLANHEIESHAKKNKIDPWVKRLYKQVVQRSHPDRFIGFSIKEIKEKFVKVYIAAVKALEENDIGLLLLCAYDVEIDITKIKEAEKYISQSIALSTASIESTKNEIGYQWYHMPELNRMIFLKQHLFSLGYIFDQEEAKKAIKKNRIKRKPGTRPEKLRVNKRKIK